MDKIKEIFADTLGIDVGQINEETSKDNTEEWDSFNHLILISEIEKEMGIKFSITDVEKINTYKILSELIEQKRN